jgi:hypothetical protein
LAALLSALTARILLLLARFLLIGLLLAALLTALAALLTLLAALIWIVGHWKRLLIAGWPRKVSTNHGYVGSRQRMELWSIFEANASQGPMKFPEHK